METSLFKPLKTSSEKLTSEVDLEIYFFVQGWSYDFRAVYLFVGSLTSSLEIRSLASLLHL